jgi:hypothetical protein
MSTITSTPAITSKAAFIRAADGKTITRTIVGGTTTLDEWDAYVIEARKQLIGQGAKDENIVETADKLEVTGSSWYCMKPKMPRIMTGIMVFRSSDFYFESDQIAGSDQPQQTFGNKKDLTLVDGKLVLTMFNKSEIHYSINA